MTEIRDRVDFRGEIGGSLDWSCRMISICQLPGTTREEANALARLGVGKGDGMTSPAYLLRPASAQVRSIAL